MNHTIYLKHRSQEEMNCLFGLSCSVIWIGKWDSFICTLGQSYVRWIPALPDGPYGSGVTKQASCRCYSAFAQLPVTHCFNPSFGLSAVRAKSSLFWLYFCGHFSVRTDLFLQNMHFSAAWPFSATHIPQLPLTLLLSGTSRQLSAAFPLQQPKPSTAGSSLSCPLICLL